MAWTLTSSLIPLPVGSSIFHNSTCHSFLKKFAKSKSLVNFVWRSTLLDAFIECHYQTESCNFQTTESDEFWAQKESVCTQSNQLESVLLPNFIISWRILPFWMQIERPFSWHPASLPNALTRNFSPDESNIPYLLFHTVSGVLTAEWKVANLQRSFTASPPNVSVL